MLRRRSPIATGDVDKTESYTLDEVEEVGLGVVNLSLNLCFDLAAISGVPRTRNRLFVEAAIDSVSWRLLALAGVDQAALGGGETCGDGVTYYEEYSGS